MASAKFSVTGEEFALHFNPFSALSGEADRQVCDDIKEGDMAVLPQLPDLPPSNCRHFVRWCDPPRIPALQRCGDAHHRAQPRLAPAPPTGQNAKARVR